MKILGINALNHDAAITLIEDDKILFAAHAERYSGIKNDSNLNKEMFKDMEKGRIVDEMVSDRSKFVENL